MPNPYEPEGPQGLDENNSVRLGVAVKRVCSGFIRCPVVEVLKRCE
jgi:hypothetical protein